MPTDQQEEEFRKKLRACIARRRQEAPALLTKGQLHLPATGQGGHAVRLHGGGEAHVGEGLGHLLLIDLALEGGVLENIRGHADVRRLGVDVVLHIHGAQLVLGREAVHLAVGNLAHEG